MVTAVTDSGLKNIILKTLFSKQVLALAEPAVICPSCCVMSSLQLQVPHFCTASSSQQLGQSTERGRLQTQAAFLVLYVVAAECGPSVVLWVI